MNKIFLVSLGCDKNRVDGEVMVGALRVNGYEVVNNPEEAVAIIINTCGFISDAVQESLDMIFQLAEYKKKNCRALVIVGCMAERYKSEIAEKIPEADAFVGVGEYEKIATLIEKIIGKPENFSSRQDEKNFSNENENFSSNEKILPRLAARSDAEASHIAYVKIAEGCDNHCSYCTIPKIRGAYVSRPKAEIINECKLLVEAGAVEIVVVAQDTALYGKEIGENLPQLLREIAATGAKRIRLMYAYPEHITPSLISAMAEIPQMCKYIDMPIQHSEYAVLSKMGRKGGKRELEQLIRVLRDRIPDIAIRTTVMVGFPGETAEDFQNLYDFAEETRFDRLGAFPYSREEGTPAAIMPNQIRSDVKQKRLHKIMELQQKIHFEKQREYVGKILPVIVDSREENGDYVGRTEFDAYEVDTVVFFSSQKILQPGQICNVKIIDVFDYDLRGAFCESAE
jgi:ribosomal protein S12 methylthiotransferase